MKRTRELASRNRIQGADEQGEGAQRARSPHGHKGKGTRRRAGGCARKARALTRGALASCLKGRRCQVQRSEKSAELAVAAKAVKERMEGRAKRP